MGWAPCSFSCWLLIPSYGINTPVKRIWVTLFCMASASLCAADFTRYQVILDRMPFGVEAVPAPPPGPGVGPNGKPLPPPDSFIKTLKMCAVTRHALTGRLQVGLVDTATKKNYFIAVGDTEDGITVVEADYDGETALLRKNDQEGRLTMSDIASMTAAVGQPGGGPGPGSFGFGGAGPGGMGRPAFPPGLTVGRPPTIPGSGDVASITPPGPGPATLRPAFPSGLTPGRVTGMRGMSDAARPTFASGVTASPTTPGATASIAANTPASPLGGQVRVRDLSSGMTNQVSAEALKKHLEQYQMDLIRSGGAKGPPLPMQLTPEMDQQLVNEGVLPAQ